jgi:transposase
MSNVLDDEKQQQVLALGRLGWTLRRIEQATTVRRETASAYLKAAGIPVHGRGRPRAGPAKPAISGEVSTDPAPATEGVPKPGRAPSASACEPYRELIVEALRRGRNAVAIWQDLVDDHGFTARYASVRRFVRKLRGSTPAEARVVITTAPGEEAQVDYGDGPMVRDPATGKYKRTRLFVLTLGYSRKSVRLLVWRSGAQVWAELHEQAFRRLGGTVRVVVLDNLREGVLTPDIYDPALNPLYRDVLAHYGVVALPCRVGDPDRKGKVESGVGHAQKTPLRGLRFETMEQGQAYLDRWETHWADTRIHGTTKRQVAVMFAEERPALGPLPLEPFRYYRYGERTVHLDGCVEVEAAYYGAPPGWIGRRVQVQWNSLHVRLLDPKTGQLLREHVRAPRVWHRIRDEDLPARTPPTTTAALQRARTAGPHIHTVCQSIHDHDGVKAIRRILGVLALAKKHGPAVVDEAAQAALEMGVPTYRFLRRYLERRPALPLTLQQVDPLIRQLTLYRDLIDRRTGDTP